MYKKILAAVLAAAALLWLCSCKDEKTVSAPKKPTHESVGETEEKEEIKEIAEQSEKEEEAVRIYAKTPEEAADKCLLALYSGNISDAKHYVSPNGSAFKELNEFRSKTMKSFGVEGNDKLKAKAEKLLDNVLSKFEYKRINTKTEGDFSTVTYSVSMPDMGSIDYSKYSDAYMAASGITWEQLMTRIESMTEEEAQEWSKEYSLDVMNYIFESGGSFKRITQTTTVTVEKHKSGWLVSNIKNLAK